MKRIADIFQKRRSMSQRTGLIRLIVLMIVFVIPVQLLAQFAGGNGTSGNPFLISNVTQLQAIRNAPNEAFFKLIANINASATAGWNGGQGFNPVGWFGGSLDGDGYTISGLVINRPGTSNCAMFTQIGAQSSMTNLNFTNISITGGVRCAAVVGTSGGTIENVNVSGNINGQSTVGGIVGQVDGGGTINLVTFSGNVNGSGSDIGAVVGHLNSFSTLTNSSAQGSVFGQSRVGGIAGMMNTGSTMNNCQSDVVVSGTGSDIGGLLGHNNGGTITNCNSSGAISGSDQVGGLIGFNGYGTSSVYNCHSAASVNGDNKVGGLIGYNQDAKVELTYSTGNVSGKSGVGGLVGYMAFGLSSIKSSFSTSSVTGSNNEIGGLVGYLQSGSIQNSFASGSASGNNKVGGLVGEMRWASVANSFSSAAVSANGGQAGGLIAANSGSSVNNSFWDYQTSGQNTSSGGTPKPTAEMNTLNTFLNAGWNFNTIWSIDPEFNDGYPFLTPLGGFFMMVWTGNIDTEWEKPGNWSSNNLPTPNETVRIPNVTNKPAISSAVVVKGLNIQPNSRVTIAHNGSLTVTGVVNNMAGTNGLVVNSTASGTGSLIHYTDGVNATFQRYVPGLPVAWHSLSSPMTNQEISGSFTPAGSYGDGTGYDFYSWYEPDTSWVYLLNTDYPPNWQTANGGNNFVPGRGYLVSYQAANPTLTFAGTMNNGTVNIGVTRSPGDTAIFGANLIGNPYPSSVDWKSASGWNRSPLESNGGGHDVWIWNEVANNYGVYNSASAVDVGSLGVTRYIAPTQGFFVSAVNSGNISVNNSARVHNGSDNWLKTTSDFISRLSLEIEPTSGTNKDQIIIELGHDEVIGGTRKKFSFIPTAPSLYLPSGDTDYSLRLLGNIQNNPVIPVSFKPGESGEHKLSASFLSYAFEMLLLEDRITGMMHDLLANPVYKFSSRMQDDPKRFVLHLLEGNYADPYAPLPVRVYTYEKTLYLDMRLLDQNGPCLLEIYDLMGQIVYSQDVPCGNIETISLINPNGIYIVRVIGKEGTISSKVSF